MSQYQEQSVVQERHNNRDRQNALAIALVTELISKSSKYAQNSLAFLEQDC